MADGPVTEIVPHERLLHIRILKRALDDESTRTLVDDVLVAAGQVGRLPIVLDMALVKFAPSVALGSLVQLSKSFSFEKRRIAIINLDRRVRETIHVTQLHKVLEIHDNLDQVAAGKV